MGANRWNSFGISAKRAFVFYLLISNIYKDETERGDCSRGGRIRGDMPVRSVKSADIALDASSVWGIKATDHGKINVRFKHILCFRGTPEKPVPAVPRELQGTRAEGRES
jgi:hypothetical protein